MTVMWHLCNGVVSKYILEAKRHYKDVIMRAMASQITSLTLVYSKVYSCAGQRMHQICASLAFVRKIHWCPVNSPYKWPVTVKMFLFDLLAMEVLQSCTRVSKYNVNPRQSFPYYTVCGVSEVRLLAVNRPTSIHYSDVIMGAMASHITGA